MAEPRRSPAAERQVRAADPTACTWLSANAGSGKTRVLTDRVARLLLRGVAPQSILCLTYTKAAAGEMQNRLFATLGGWAMLDDAPLRARLAELGADEGTDPDTLRRARRLFARAIETPGGLKIQTIHAFCAGLLRRFPLEAGVSPGFVEIDERAARLMQDAVLDRLADAAPDTFDAVAGEAGGNLSKLVAEVVRYRAALAPPPEPAALWQALGLAPGFDEAALLARVFTGAEAGFMPAVVAALGRGSVNDVKAAAVLRGLDWANPDIVVLEALEGPFLFGAKTKTAIPFGPKIGSFPTRDTRAALGAHLADLEALMQRVADARPARVALAAARRSAALHRFAGAFLPAYAAAKAAAGALDFDDLVERALALLSDPGVAQWVLYKLDGAVNHILVDEAQDTSPAQWQLIDRLSAEMTAGTGAADASRTLFVVGDRKQSIYSFQGADLRAFDAMQAHFDAALGAMGHPLQRLTLEHSFRSSPAVLRAVDATFDHRRGRGLGGPVVHEAFFADMPGRVDLWPALPEDPREDPPEWFDPVDILPDSHVAVRLAEALADHIAGLLEAGTLLPGRDGPRRLRAGDILILVRRRSVLFQHLIRACKARGLPMAGADRMTLTTELAVRDLTALLAFLDMPEDDLSLAAVLRSPLCGLDEGALFDLAHGRPGHLWEALRAVPDRHPEAFAMLSDLRDQADFLRPYELLERCLIRHDGRRRLLARLGAEAEDGIDALLDLALRYEDAEVPGLSGFLVWLSSGEVQVKRQAEGAGDRIRVMTVHGAKGLQAPVVILPDTARPGPPRPSILAPVGDVMTWPPAADALPEPQAEARAEAAAARQEEEERLLYVAMTRAESWLIVAAAGKTDDPDCWHARIASGLEHCGSEALETPFGGGARLSFGAWPAPAGAATGAGETAPSPLPDWLSAPAPVPDRVPSPLSPSALGGAKALPGEAAQPRDEAEERARGTRLHRLLEHLPLWPEARWPDLAADLLAQDADGPPDAADTAALLEEARAVLAAPELAFLFAPGTLAEVGIAAPLGPHRMLGSIDRLVVAPDRVLAVDYKSNAVIPARPDGVPEGLVRQMAAYRAGLRALFPDRAVEVALLWTRAARLMPLPDAMLDAALSRALAGPVPGVDLDPRDLDHGAAGP